MYKSICLLDQGRTFDVTLTEGPGDVPFNPKSNIIVSNNIICRQ